MPRMLMRVVVGLVAIAGLAVASWATLSRVEAQNATTGTWTASVSKEKDKINLNFERRTEKGGRHQHGQTFDFSE